MKKLTKKVILSFFSLALIVSVLGASTYAWFTIGDTITISKFEMDVQGGDGLEVAYIYGNNSKEGYVSRITSERILGYLGKDYYGETGDFASSFEMNDVTSADGINFKYLEYSEADNVGSYSLKTADRVDNGFVEFTLRFRTLKQGNNDIYLIWENGTLESEGINKWTPGVDFTPPVGTLIEAGNSDYTYFSSHAARISVSDTKYSSTNGLYEKANVYELGEKAMADGNYLNTVLSNETPNWTQGNLEIFKKSTTIDLSDEYGSYKAAKTFTSFVEDEDVIVAKFLPAASFEEAAADNYLYAEVTIRVYIEGFDAEAFDGILEDPLTAMLSFGYRVDSN